MNTSNGRVDSNTVNTITKKYIFRLFKLILYMALGVGLIYAMSLLLDFLFFSKDSTDIFFLLKLFDPSNKYYIFVVILGACGMGSESVFRKRKGHFFDGFRSFGKAVKKNAKDFGDDAGEILDHTSVGVMTPDGEYWYSGIPILGSLIAMVFCLYYRMFKIGIEVTKDSIKHNKESEMPFFGPLYVPVFLVYFMIMIIPEIFVGKFSDQVVEKLDKLVLTICRICLIFILILGVGYGVKIYMNNYS